jgi:hypothetical protein
LETKVEGLGNNMGGNRKASNVWNNMMQVVFKKD